MSPSTHSTQHFSPPLVTIDIEDWFQSEWNRDFPVSSGSADNVRHLLDLLDELDLKVTLFVLGKFAETFPHLIQDAHERGHEIGSHGHGHIPIFTQTPDEFRVDVQHSQHLLEDLIGDEVRGYRAPDFSIVQDSLWALGILSELNFKYDSSIFPVKRDRYGIPSWPISPRRVSLDGGMSILEFPIAAIKFGGINWPIGGGGYHRLIPGFLSRFLASKAMEKAPYIFYCHPFEFNASELWNSEYNIPLFTRLHQGLGRGCFEARFRGFVGRFGGGKVWDYIQSQNSWEEIDI